MTVAVATPKSTNDASLMIPKEIFAKAVEKSVKDCIFTVAWALITTWLLTRWWWLAAGSFGALVIVTAVDVPRLVGLTLSLPAVAGTQIASGDRWFLTFAVLVQILESMVSVVLCVWLYLTLF